MRKVMAAYWHRDGLDIYSCAGAKPSLVASGTLEGLRPIKSGLGIKVLILGRERLMHLRKRYPPAPLDKLTKAVAMEIADIFPFSKPSFYCRLFNSFSNYVELDIWAWEAELYERLKKKFPFSHAIPEDVLFTADKPEVSIFSSHGLVHMVAHARNRFLESTSHPLDGFKELQVSRFLFNLNQSGAEIKRIRIYGLSQLQITDTPGLEVFRTIDTGYPPCLEGLAHVDLRGFKIKGGYLNIPQPALIMRLGLYLVLGYVLMLFLTSRNYDKAMAEIRQRIAAMDKKALAMDASSSVEDYADVVQAVNARLQKGLTPLNMMNMLAKRLPDGAYVSRFTLTEGSAELLVSSQDPLAVVKALGGSDNIKKVMIKGAPARDKSTGFYNFVVLLELIK